MYRYSVILLPYEDGYSVSVPALGGVATMGETREEALEMARDLIALTVAGMIADGEEVILEERPGEAELCVVEVDEADLALVHEVASASS
jgi:predicted RNase H-like HicB family nuclease